MLPNYIGPPKTDAGNIYFTYGTTVPANMMPSTFPAYSVPIPPAPGYEAPKEDNCPAEPGPTASIPAVPIQVQPRRHPVDDMDEEQRKK